MLDHTYTSPIGVFSGILVLGGLRVLWCIVEATRETSTPNRRGCKRDREEDRRELEPDTKVRGILRNPRKSLKTQANSIGRGSRGSIAWTSMRACQARDPGSNPGRGATRQNLYLVWCRVKLVLLGMQGGRRSGSLPHSELLTWA